LLSDVDSADVSSFRLSACIWDAFNISVKVTSHAYLVRDR
jgi:hypothetical protein